MKCHRVRWKDWSAVRCATDGAEIIVGVSAGPRILSLRQGGQANLLYEEIFSRANAAYAS